MGYSYSGVVDGLKEFYSSMRKLNVEIGTFEHTYTGIVSDAIFGTRDTAGWQLTFIKRIDGAVLRIPIQLGYRFSINGNEEYDTSVLHKSPPIKHQRAWQVYFMAVKLIFATNCYTITKMKIHKPLVFRVF
jgi:hypothetical protein